MLCDNIYMVENTHRSAAHKKNRHKGTQKANKRPGKKTQTKVYVCTLCKETAIKPRVGEELTARGSTEITNAGLGKWRCRTHGKCKVTVLVAQQPAQQTEEKAA